MAFILGSWILMSLLDANRADDLVRFVQDAATWPAGRSHDQGGLGMHPGEHSTSDAAGARVVTGYGLAAVVSHLVGHAVAGRLRRR
ncbi:hypothetical protein [Streptomyces poriticola]|uniref:hypothetical protein n=1 Tax=Streptomyces poriticola TaxID=3120506 RepID=UPI002FCDF79E